VKLAPGAASAVEESKKKITQRRGDAEKAQRRKLETRKRKVESEKKDKVEIRKEKLESREKTPTLPGQEPGKGGECGDYFEASAMVSSEASNDGHRGPRYLPSLNCQRLKRRADSVCTRLNTG
jgi:hypothetical protein